TSSPRLACGSIVVIGAPLNVLHRFYSYITARGVTARPPAAGLAADHGQHLVALRLHQLL
ncbi:MAG TPA: hypothetical protein VIU16_09195, partial [Gaiellaceae bacterium]